MSESLSVCGVEERLEEPTTGGGGGPSRACDGSDNCGKVTGLAIRRGYFEGDIEFVRSLLGDLASVLVDATGGAVCLNKSLMPVGRAEIGSDLSLFMAKGIKGKALAAFS